MTEVELTGPVSITRHAQIVGEPEISTELKCVVPKSLTPVVHDLELMFVLIEGAVAPGHVQPISGRSQNGGNGVEEERSQTGGSRNLRTGREIHAGDVEQRAHR